MTAAEALAAAAAKLRAAGVADPARDARVLLAHAAKIDAARVTLIAPEDLSPDIEERFANLVSLRAVRVPVSHLVGEREFYGRAFKVSGDVLDPRPETETLIEAALAEPFGSVLDLGVGSGCILVTLLAERPHAVGVGIDLSEMACLQASANAHLHKVDSRTDIRQSDWFGAVRERFDLIVSNPPYLTAQEYQDAQPELREHEPEIALTDGLDGLDAYRQIAEGAARHLEPGGRVLVEIGATQAKDVVAIFESAGATSIHLLNDLDGRNRVVAARFDENQ